MCGTVAVPTGRADLEQAVPARSRWREVSQGCPEPGAKSVGHSSLPHHLRSGDLTRDGRPYAAGSRRAGVAARQASPDGTGFLLALIRFLSRVRPSGTASLPDAVRAFEYSEDK
ncbi:hypothetical protein AAFF_G00105240 [Aldrovandia affinis]|uniref:Uncharacterized protein n=1 Tax=Aldrovandia affinis TaxID=143900 RepID=A0AAD7T367_9TELE|nr:hypothetical protein AAFF_G00105240 [Aldrovandia affinis]